MFEDQVLNERISEILPEWYDKSFEIQDGKVYLVDENGAVLPPVVI